MRARQATIELEAGRDYHVLRGSVYENHDPETCFQCRNHPRYNDPSWLKIHAVDQSGDFHGPPMDLVLAVSPRVRILPEVAIHEHAGREGAAFGSVLSDIFDFIKRIILAILSFIGQLLARLVHDLLHPLDLIKDIFKAILATIQAVVFIIKWFPITRWVYQGLNWLTGGFLDNLVTLIELPFMFFSGQKITRQMLLSALSVVITVLSFAIMALTGGLVLAIIGLSVNLLKAGPLGKTALGRTLLDIVGIGLEALAGDGDLVKAFVNAGEHALEKTAVGALANRLHLSKIVTGLLQTGTGAVTPNVMSTPTSDDEEQAIADAAAAQESAEDAVEPPETPETPGNSASPESPESPEAPEAPGSGEAEPTEIPAVGVPGQEEAAPEEVSPGDEETEQADADAAAKQESEEDAAEPASPEEPADYSTTVDILKASQSVAEIAKTLLTPGAAQTSAQAKHAAAPVSPVAAPVASPALIKLQTAVGISNPGSPQAQKTLMIAGGLGIIAVAYILKELRS